MIYTVTFNPSLDYNVEVDDFTTGCINRTKKEHMIAGGKGINVSVVLQNLGHTSTALGFVAGFTGDQICHLLEEQGIRTDFIRLDQGCSRINVKLHSDTETEINGQGPGIGADSLKLLYKKLDRLQEGDVLVLAGSIPPSLPETIYRDIMEYLAARQVKIVVDATNELLLNVLPLHPFLIKPNHHELGEIFQTKIKGKQDVVTYAKKLQERGAVNVLVSMAGDGAVLLAEDGRVYESAAPDGIVRNPVGAGDSMVAGFVAGYQESGDYKKALVKGLCAGSASAFSDDLATADAVEALLSQLSVG
ncbi:MAG: 1-phosphofructokinase [Lachnospiraceae bacterium]|nr:1-phosphofructokinase [Lachnospiraceae bacterium]